MTRAVSSTGMVCEPGLPCATPSASYTFQAQNTARSSHSQLVVSAPSVTLPTCRWSKDHQIRNACPMAEKKIARPRWRLPSRYCPSPGTRMDAAAASLLLLGSGWDTDSTDLTDFTVRSHPEDLNTKDTKDSRGDACRSVHWPSAVHLPARRDFSLCILCALCV